MEIKVFSEKQAQSEINLLKKQGYSRTQNCYWTEVWTHENKAIKKVVLTRDF